MHSPLKFFPSKVILPIFAALSLSFVSEKGSHPVHFCHTALSLNREILPLYSDHVLFLLEEKMEDVFNLEPTPSPTNTLFMGKQLSFEKSPFNWCETRR